MSSGQERWTQDLCWSAAKASQVVHPDVAALTPGNTESDAVFLATHSPSRLRRYIGSVPQDQIVDEQALLDDFVTRLAKDVNDNTVIAVTGGSGTGKSHVVRWLHARLPARDDLRVLYVPKRLTNLRELLRVVVEGLGEEQGQE